MLEVTNVDQLIAELIIAGQKSANVCVGAIIASTLPTNAKNVTSLSPCLCNQPPPLEPSPFPSVFSFPPLADPALSPLTSPNSPSMLLSPPWLNENEGNDNRQQPRERIVAVTIPIAAILVVVLIIILIARRKRSGY